VFLAVVSRRSQSDLLNHRRPLRTTVAPLGFSLTRGPGGLRYADGQVVCPWHNSRFDLASGDNLDWAPGFAGRDMPRWSRKLIALGRKPSPLTTYDVKIEGDDVYVEL
jgi:hypothetical protein